MNSIFIFHYSIDLKNFPVSEVYKIDLSKFLIDWVRPTLDLTHKPIQRTMDHTTANTILGAKGFKLREGYQEQGVDWMLNREWHWNPEEKPKLTDVYGGILADEMGLGKTIQTIAVMETNRFCNTLLIVPASLIEMGQKFTSFQAIWNLTFVLMETTWDYSMSIRNLAQYSLLATRPFSHTTSCSRA